jgi:hypothetical protein
VLGSTAAPRRLPATGSGTGGDMPGSGIALLGLVAGGLLAGSLAWRVRRAR